MDISLIIPAHNEENWIGKCLESVIEHAPGKFKEIIVVDNASTDRTGAVAASYPGVRVVRQSRKGVTLARQTGVETSQSKWVAFVDADCLLTPGYVEILEAHQAQHPEAVAFSGPVKYSDAPAFVRLLGTLVQWIVLPITQIVTGHVLLGGNFIARRDALEKVGGFDSSIAFYGEDADIARRLSAVGPCVFKMDLSVYTSARRIRSEGIVVLYVRYACNFLWDAFFHRPLHTAYTDVRP